MENRREDPKEGHGDDHGLIERLPARLKMGELRAFVAVLEHRSFRKAAVALRVTQPAVTKTIAGMETLLKVKLFNRLADGVEPTSHGLSFAPHAIAIFDELRGAAQALGIVARGAAGTLRIGTVPMPSGVSADRDQEPRRRPSQHLCLGGRGTRVRSRHAVAQARDRTRDLPLGVVQCRR